MEGVMDKKVERIINLYTRLSKGEVLNKADEAQRFDVNERSIQRDLEDIRAYFESDINSNCELIYDRGKRGYVLVQNHKESLTNSEVLTVCKILLESRSLVKEEMYPIIDKLLQCCVPYDNYKKVADLLANEKFHYLEPHHGKKFVNTMWDIGSAVNEHRLMKIRYKKLKEPDNVMRMIQPVGLMFSEYYFYLCAYICTSEEIPDVPKRPFPTIYRIDRIEEYEILDEHFHVPYADRFEEGEFRKRIQFMYGGELRTIKFMYKGMSIEAVLDRFPTAQILEHNEKGWIIKAEVYGDGVDIWLRGQGDVVEVVDDGKIGDE
jgi:predicted DNA-binding transcriptional regulator YafY